MINHNYSPSTQHIKHIIHTKYTSNYDSFQLHAMRVDTTPICMWYQITADVITPDAN